MEPSVARAESHALAGAVADGAAAVDGAAEASADKLSELNASEPGTYADLTSQYTVAYEFPSRSTNATIVITKHTEESDGPEFKLFIAATNNFELANDQWLITHTNGLFLKKATAVKTMSEGTKPRTCVIVNVSRTYARMRVCFRMCIHLQSSACSPCLASGGSSTFGRLSLQFMRSNNNNTRVRVCIPARLGQGTVCCAR
jgi:hypothetical protein